MMHIAIVGRTSRVGLDKCWLSTEVFQELLLESLGAQPGVTVSRWRTNAAGLPSCDVALVHDYVVEASGFIERAWQGGLKTAAFMELPYPADVSFAFLPDFDCTAAVILPYPYDARRIGPSAKVAGSILIDHAWADALNDPMRENTIGILCVAQELASSRRIAQFTRADRKFAPDVAAAEDDIPEGIEPVHPMPYLDYVDFIRPWETFVVTHQGSYNGAIVDLAATGARIVAKQGFVTPCQRRDLEIIKYTTHEELEQILLEPVPVNRRLPEALTPMDEAARRIVQELRGLADRDLKKPLDRCLCRNRL